jgi:tetratricopeptide (TPR) repeat protein/predicted transcriptional regulator
VPARKYNPGFLTDDELVAAFCVRTKEFDSIIETLHENDGNSNQHLIVIGPRGSGKTSLLLRVAVEVRRDIDLSSRMFPITFAEESYEVGTCGEFWLECLDRLARQAPQADSAAALRRTWEDLRLVQDDQSLAERCLGALLDFADHNGKRLVLLVENLNMMLGDMMDPDSGWRLRKTLQTEPRIILVGSATSRFDEIDRPDKALYDLFRLITLRPLDTTECGVIWKSICGDNSQEGKIRALQILTGGSPRLITIVAQFGAGRPFHELLDDLLELIDEHTEYFKSHLDALAHQERRIYLALADQWMPATTREIADRTRLSSSTCSAQLKRLIHRGVVTEAGGTPRRKQYYLVERMYNIYYLLRRQGTARVVEPLIHFMTAFYSQPELVERIISEASKTDKRNRSIYREMLEQLSAAPQMRGRRNMLLEMSQDLSEPRPSAEDLRVLFDDYEKCMTHGQLEEAIVVCDQIVARTAPHKDGEQRRTTAQALLTKGMLLGQLNRSDEAIVIYDQLMERFGRSAAREVLVLVATALVNKGVRLDALGRFDEELDVYTDVLDRFRMNSLPEIEEKVAVAMVNRGNTLEKLGRSKEAVQAYEQVVDTYGEEKLPELVAQVVLALSNRAATLVRTGKLPEALATFDDIARRFQDSELVKVSVVVEALVNKGVVLYQLNQPQEALDVFVSVVTKYGGLDSADVAPHLAKSMLNEGTILTLLNRVPEAFRALDELVERFADSEASEVVALVVRALLNKGITLVDQGNYRKSKETCEEAVRRFGMSNDTSVEPLIACALVTKGVALTGMNELMESLKVYDEVVGRYVNSTVESTQEQVAGAMVNKGAVLQQLGKWEEALTIFDEMLGHASGIPAQPKPGQVSIQTRDRLEKLGISLANKMVILLRILNTHRSHNELIERYGSVPVCERDLSLALAVISGIGEVSAALVRAVLVCCARIGAERAVQVVGECGAREVLLPVIVALQRELGHSQRVAQEVDEVARDIERNLAKLRSRWEAYNREATD